MQGRRDCVYVYARSRLCVCLCTCVCVSVRRTSTTTLLVVNQSKHVTVPKCGPLQRHRITRPLSALRRCLHSRPHRLKHTQVLLRTRYA
jgi:hypothetical protein